ncbi:polysaccharide pyruvyl transferase family protein [Hyphomicrobiales bacterium]
MKLIYFQGVVPNFGDELNPYMWSKILPPGFLNEDSSELFLGIGSILHKHGYPSEAIKHVLGSGYAGYGSPPEINDGSWNIVFVRGPRTAATLGLPPEKAIADGAILLRTIDLPEPREQSEVAFMPHYESLNRGFWPEACKLAGIKLIDPTRDLDEIIGQIRGAKLLVTEAMHGAIVADALRTPWVSARPIYSGHHAKWLDWAEALSLDLRQPRLWPSSIAELYTRLTRRGSPESIVGRLNKRAVATPANAILTYAAAKRLQQLAKMDPQLSRDDVIERQTQRAQEAIFSFVSTRTESVARA